MTLWAPVVYGRTATSDTWWRAVPEGLDEHGWLGTVVHSALAAGRELKEGPRFLLAQDAAHRVVGVACQAGDLSNTMNSIESRELFCFVGWVAARTNRSGPDDTPALQELEHGYRDWAAPVYGRILSDVWNASATTYLPPVRTQPEEPLWAPPIRRVKPGLTPDTGPWAEQAWPVVWAAAQAASEPLTYVTGWQNITSARFEDATHIGVADAPLRPPPAVEYEGPLAAPNPEWSPELTPAQSASPPVPVASMVPDGPSADGPEIPVAEQAVSEEPERTARPGERSHGWRSPLDRGPTWAKLAVAAALGAAVVGVAVTLASPSGASSTTHPPPPSSARPSVGPSAVGSPLLLEIVIPASGQPTTGSLVQYYAGALSLGQSAVSMAVWPGGLAVGPAACARTVVAAPVVTPVKARRGVWLCVELKGSPSRYGLIRVTAITKTAVTATATLWP